MRATYKCDKCNHGQCMLTVDDNEGVGKLDIPTVCPYDIEQVTNWELG